MRVSPETTICSSRFLAGLDQEAARTILAAAQSRRVRAKQPIQHEGGRGTLLFLIRKGRVKLFRLTKAGNEIVLAWLVAKDVFGLVALLRNPPGYMVSAEAVSDCDLIVWKHSDIRELARMYPQLAENSLHIVMDYLRTHVNRHIGLVTKTAEERFAGVLLSLAHRTGQVHPEGVEVDVTNQHLSALADISRFTASRLMKEWARKGALSKQRGKILIHSPEALVLD